MAHLARTYDLSPRAAKDIATFRALIAAKLTADAYQVVSIPPSALVVFVMDTAPSAQVQDLDAAFAGLSPVTPSSA